MELTFARLSDIPLEEITSHMREERILEHMPLLTKQWDQAATTGLIAAKEACWLRDGLGHWAFLFNGTYAGWGGFQKEGDEWDFGLVLKSSFFGLGLVITRKALEFARADSRIPYVTFLLPPSRKHLKGLARLGARYIGDVTYQDISFHKYRLDTN